MPSLLNTKLDDLLDTMSNSRSDPSKELLKFAKLWNELMEHYTKSPKVAEKDADRLPIANREVCIRMLVPLPLVHITGWLYHRRLF
jgi:hypothetical protein